MNWNKLEKKAKDSVKFTNKNNKTYNISKKCRVNKNNIQLKNKRTSYR